MGISLRNAAVIGAATASLSAPVAALASSLPTSYSIHTYSGVTAMPNSGSASAGVVQIPDNDWYNENLPAQTSGSYSFTLSSETEVNGSDISPTITANYGFNNNNTATSQENFGAGDPSDSDLYSGYIGSNAGNGITISFSSIPSTFTSTGYDIYLYFATNNAATTTLTDGNGVTFATHGSSQNLNAFVEATPGSTATTAGDYAEFSESNSSVTVTFTQANPGGLWVSGIQIVQVPEPATLGLLGAVGSLAMLRRRRRGLLDAS